MSDLIDRQAAIQWVKTECNPYGKPTIDFESGKKVIEHLKQMPSSETEIVRCKDCVNYTRGKDGWGSCFENPMKLWRDTDYCSWGERKENDPT